MESSSPQSWIAQSWIARTFASIVDHPWVCSSALILLISLALGGYYRPTWPQDMWRGLKSVEAEKEEANQKANERRQTPAMNVERNSLGRAQAFLVVSSKQFFSREGAAAIRDIVDTLEQQDTIASIQWLDQAPPLNIFGLSEPILPRGQASPQRFALAKEKALKHPLVVGMFLSKDANTLLIGINFNWIFVDEDAI